MPTLVPIFVYRSLYYSGLDLTRLLNSENNRRFEHLFFSRNSSICVVSRHRWPTRQKSELLCSGKKALNVTNSGWVWVYVNFWSSSFDHHFVSDYLVILTNCRIQQLIEYFRFSKRLNVHLSIRQWACGRVENGNTHNCRQKRRDFYHLCECECGWVKIHFRN